VLCVQAFWPFLRAMAAATWTHYLSVNASAPPCPVDMLVFNELLLRHRQSFGFEAEVTGYPHGFVSLPMASQLGPAWRHNCSASSRAQPPFWTCVRRRLKAMQPQYYLAHKVPCNEPGAGVTLPCDWTKSYAEWKREIPPERAPWRAPRARHQG